MTLQDVLGGAEPQWQQVQTPQEDGEGPERLDPQVGDTVVGTYMGDKEFLSKYPNPKTGAKDKINHLLTFKLLDGRDASFFAKGNLWYQMQNVAPGTLVKLERFPDEESKQGYTVQTWAVFTAS